MSVRDRDRFGAAARRWAAWAVGLALIAAAPSPLSADESIRGPAQPSSAQAIAAAKRLWSAVRARDRGRIAAAAAAPVRMRASVAGLVVKDDHEADVERARFAELMTELDLGTERAEGWRRLEQPPFTTPAGTVWVGADVQASTGSEGHGARTGDLAFGVRLVGGRALVVAFDVSYAESHLIYSR
jgi:hypothetical protein